MLNQHIKLAQKITLILDDNKKYKAKIESIKELFNDNENIAILLGSVAILNKLTSDRDEVSSINAEYSLHKEIYTDDYERGAQNRANHEVSILLDKLGLDSPDED